VRNLMFYSIIVVLLGGVVASAGPTPDKPGKAPAVALYGDVNKKLHMVFDLENSGLLHTPSANIKTLEVPSQPINPWTGFHSGIFYVTTDTEGKKVVQFGKAEYHTIGGFRLFTMRRDGTGEKALGSDVNGKIWAVDSNGPAKPIAQRAYRLITTEKGSQRRVLMHQTLNPPGKWTGDLGNKIVQEIEGGKLTQIGWVEWRVITLTDGKRATIVMTKGMEKDSKWTGRYQGVLYREK
jgi:hypothetical protein